MNKNFENFDDFNDFQKENENSQKNDVKYEYEDISSTSLKDNNSELDSNSDSHRKNGKKKKDVKRIVVNVVTSIILVLSILVTTSMGWIIKHKDENINELIKKSPLLQFLLGDVKFDDIAYDDNGKIEIGDFEKLKLSSNTNVSYFLVVGCDWTDTKQTDVIVVVCLDHKKNTCSMLQIPRDTYVSEAYAPYGNKINSVYMSAKEGELKINALRRCLSNQLGIPIDHYILFSIEGAVNVVDAIGGVRMNLKNPVEIENPLKFGRYYTIGPGKVKLKGKDAIGFMRKRYGTQDEDQNYDGSDIGRVKQQRKFYAALFKKLKKTSDMDMLRIAKNSFNQIQTNLTLKEAVAYANAVKENIEMKDVHIFGLPGQAATYNGISYYSIHRDDYLECFNKYFNPYGKKLTDADFGCPEIYTLAGYDKNNNWLTGDDSTLNEYK